MSTAIAASKDATANGSRSAMAPHDRAVTPQALVDPGRRRLDRDDRPVGRLVGSGASTLRDVPALDDRAPHEWWNTGNHEADHPLSKSGDALLIGMVRDQRMR